MKLREFCAACRESAGLSQQEFAEAIGLTSAQSICNYEKGRDKPSFAVLERMAERAGLRLDDCLMFLDPASHPTREEEDAEARELLDGLLDSPYREGVITYLHGFRRPRRDRASRRRKARSGDGAGDLDSGSHVSLR